MTAPRDRILAAIRSALGGSRRATPQAIAAEAAALLDAPDAVRPTWTQAPADRFVAKLTAPRLAATVERVARLSDLPAAVRCYLAAHGLLPAIALQPAAALTALDWSGIRLNPTLARDEPVGVALARWGIAETGSLVFHSGPDAPVLLTFLPLHHIVALPLARLLPHLEDYAAAVRDAPPPRNVNWVTGISGTTDIEGAYVPGAHGPRFLHVVLVED